VLAAARRVLSELAGCVAAKKTAGLLDETCSSVALGEARGWIWLVHA
jgi:hypothetical protein